LVVEEVGEALALHIGVEVDADVAFLFLFSAADSVRVCIATIGFYDRGPLNTSARGGLPTAACLPVNSLVAAAGRTGPVLPNLFRGVAGVESGADSLPKNSGGHAGTSSGAIPAASGEKCGADDDRRRFWAGVAAG
jgi:hypothetical protein